MNYKIAVCDDDAAQRDYLAGIVAQWAKRRRCLAEVRQYPEGGAFLFAYGEEKDFDILLLDVKMPGVNGVELAKAVRRDNASVQIIFITGYYEYFSEGFDVSALHYLIKPVDADKLMPVLNRAAENLSSRWRSVLISAEDADVKIPLADIRYIEAENVYVAVHTAQGIFRTRCSLAKFSEQLDETFFKVHRSYIVSLKDIVRITRSEIVMAGGDQLPISRGMYGKVHEALIRYL